MFEIVTKLGRKYREALQNLTLSNWQKVLIIAVIGVMLLCYMVTHPVQEEGEIAYRATWLVLTGAALSIIYYAWHTRHELNVKCTILLVLILVFQVSINYMLGLLHKELPGEITYDQLLLVFPYTLGPSLISALLGRKLGVYMALCTSLFGMVLMPLDCSSAIMDKYLIISLIAGLISAMLSHRIQRREHIIIAGVVSGVVVFVSAVALGCFQPSGLASIRGGFNLVGFASEAAVTLGVSFFVSAIAGGVMPVIEKLFNISTYITWLEWGDTHHPLLLRLDREAPSTMQHCTSVQRLTAAAAEAIGADVACASACALFHDIGKLSRPEIFAENIADQANSPHNDMSAEASARLIVQHVQDGVELARKYKLNSRIIDVIREHHGVSTAYFFYRKAQDKYKEDMKKFEEGLIDTRPEEVDSSIFTYKGPIPQTRESGIISMADAVESAARSLVTPTEADIQAMIESIFKGRIQDGHLQDSHLTLGDVAKIKKAFFTTLRTMHHKRIAYPKPKEEEAEDLIQKERKKQEGGTGTEGVGDNTAKVAQ